jgi:hypothetical protein
MGAFKQSTITLAHQQTAHTPQTVHPAVLDHTQHKHDSAISQLLGSWEVKQGAHYANLTYNSRCLSPLQTTAVSSC